MQRREAEQEEVRVRTFDECRFQGARPPKVAEEEEDEEVEEDEEGDEEEVEEEGVEEEGQEEEEEEEEGEEEEEEGEEGEEEAEEAEQDEEEEQEEEGERSRWAVETRAQGVTSVARTTLTHLYYLKNSDCEFKIIW